MLSYCKMILEKMTIDTNLFRKELNKAYKMLPSEEAQKLNQWVMHKFPDLVGEDDFRYLKAS